MIRERLKELRSADATPATLVELGELAVQAGEDVALASLARAIEAAHARSIGRQQHAVVAGAEILELWPRLRALPVPEKDEDDLRRRLVWGMKYVAGSAMDLPEIPLATTDGVLAALDEMLDHFGYQKFALWTLQGRRAYIAGDDVRELAAQIAPTVTRYNHVYQCADCPGCVYLQFAEWLGPEADADDVEEAMAPILGRRPYLPDPEHISKLLDLLYGRVGTCENAERTAPIRLSRAYARAGRLPEALREAERALALAGTQTERRARALVARTQVAVAMRASDAKTIAAELVDRAGAIEDAYEQLDGLVVAHGALGGEELARRALAVAERLDARVEKKRHVAATRRALGA